MRSSEETLLIVPQLTARGMVARNKAFSVVVPIVEFLPPATGGSASLETFQQCRKAFLFRKEFDTLLYMIGWHFEQIDFNFMWSIGGCFVVVVFNVLLLF